MWKSAVAPWDALLRYQKYGEKGGEGGIELAQELLRTLEEKPSNYRPLYPDSMPLAQKIETIAKENLWRRRRQL
mgnify:CR=1 FL=1